MDRIYRINPKNGIYSRRRKGRKEIQILKGLKTHTFWVKI